MSHGEPAHGERDERDHWNVGSGEFELGTDGPAVILVGIDDTVTSLRAAAYAAGLAVGFFKDIDDLRGRWSVDQTWKPQMDAGERRRLYGFWKKAVTRSFDWVE